MTELSNNIASYLRENHVLSLAVLQGDGFPWACNAFYVFDEERMSLYILSEHKTTHAKAMLHNPNIAGTIAKNPKTVAKIKGIQFRAIARLLDGDDAKRAYEHYYHAFPFARMLKAPIWGLALNKLKMTNNLLGFAHKEAWEI